MKSLSESQIKKFKDEGFLRIDNVISKEEFTLIRSKYDNLFIESSSEGLLKKKLGGIDSSGRDTLQQVIGVSVSNPNFAKLEYRKNITKIARLLIGDSANFRNDHAILKPAKYGASTPWHQDQAYHDPRFLYKSINFWLPLQEVTVESGCLWYVPYTHKGTVVPHKYLDPNDDQTAMVAENQSYWQLNGVSVPCPERSVVLHHSYALHYAGPNNTENPRRAYICVFEAQKKLLEKPLKFPWL